MKVELTKWKDTEGSPKMFTVGYGNRKPDDFLSLLKEHGVRVIIDVRAKPKGWSPYYSLPFMDKWLFDKGTILYVWVSELGNPNSVEPDKYEPTKKGLKALKNELETYNCDCMALMCAELDPNRCHRKKIAEALKGVNIVHIR